MPTAVNAVAILVNYRGAELLGHLAVSLPISYVVFWLLSTLFIFAWRTSKGLTILLAVVLILMGLAVVVAILMGASIRFS